MNSMTIEDLITSLTSKGDFLLLVRNTADIKNSHLYRWFKDRWEQSEQFQRLHRVFILTSNPQDTLSLNPQGQSRAMTEVGPFFPHYTMDVEKIEGPTGAGAISLMRHLQNVILVCDMSYGDNQGDLVKFERLVNLHDLLQIPGIRRITLKVVDYMNSDPINDTKKEYQNQGFMTFSSSGNNWNYYTMSAWAQVSREIDNQFYDISKSGRWKASSVNEFLRLPNRPGSNQTGINQVEQTVMEFHMFIVTTIIKYIYPESVPGREEFIAQMTDLTSERIASVWIQATIHQSYNWEFSYEAMEFHGDRDFSWAFSNYLAQ